jgi:transketolase
VLRPADANETSHAYRIAVGDDVPTAILLTRQDVPVLEGTEDAFEGVSQGAYVLVEDEAADITLIGSGSEVQLCVAARFLLAERHIAARVVSMPSWDLFESASDDYQDSVLPVEVPVLAVEAASSFGWDRYADATVSIDTYGASGDGGDVFAHFGFTADHVADEAIALLASLAPPQEGE